MVLRVRDSQLDAFRDRRRLDFEARVAAHLAQCFPPVCAALGPHGVAALVHTGLERCAAWGISAERDTVRFVDLMAALGPDFDDGAAYPWAREILSSGVAATDRVNALAERAARALAAEAGPSTK